MNPQHDLPPDAPDVPAAAAPDPANDPDNEEHQPGGAYKISCPKCGAKAPEEFVNPDIASMGGMLEDDHSPEGEALKAAVDYVKAVVKVVEIPAPLAPGTSELEVIPQGRDPEQIEALRVAIERIGETMFVRNGHYYVATTRYGPTRNALMQLPYVAGVG